MQPKEKPKMCAPKMLDKAAAMPREAKNILMAQYRERQGKGKEQDNQPPEHYAQEQVFDTMKGGGNYAADAGKRSINTLRKKAKEGRQMKQEAYYRGDIPHEGFSEQTGGGNPSRSGNAGQSRPSPSGGSSPPNATARKRNPLSDKANSPKAASQKAAFLRPLNQPVIKTRQASAAKKVASKKKRQTTQKAMKQTAQKVAKAAKEAAKATAKAIATVVKAAVRGLVALLSMGWPVILVLIAAVAIGGLLCSAFGIFYSGNDANSIPITQVIEEVNGEFQSRIDTAVNNAAGGQTDIEIHYGGDIDGDGDMTNNWADVLGIYAVKTTSGTEGQDVVTVTPEKAEILKGIFWDMNKISATAETVIIPAPTPDASSLATPSPAPTPTTKTIVTIKVDSMGYEEAAELYSFDEQQKKLLDELMSPQYYAMFAQLAGVDLYDGLTPEELAEINANLPVGELGAEIVKAALTRVGDPYVLGASGEGRTVDCSSFCRWAYKQLGISLPRTSVEQAKYCSNNNVLVSKEQLQPGDLVFWSKTSCNCGRWNEIHHVGIYIGGGKVVEASSSKGRVVVRVLWGASGTWRYVMFGRPYVKAN